MENKDMKATNNETTENNTPNNDIRTTEEKKQRKRISSAAKWTGIAILGIAVIGGAVYLITKGHKVPTETVEKAAEIMADAASTAVV